MFDTASGAGTSSSVTGGGGGPTSGGGGGAGGTGDGDSGAATTGPKFDVGAGGSGGNGGDGGPPSGCDAQMPEEFTSQGCMFWAVDLPQPWWSEQNGTVPPEDGTFAVAVANASDTPAMVRVYVGAGDIPVDSATVPVGGLHTFPLSPMNIDPQQSSADGVAYRIESDVPVTAYQFNTLEQTSSRFSADASALFPVHVLRKDYTTFTSDAFWLSFEKKHVGAFISIVANYDGTQVDVYPTNDLLPGAASQGVILDRGEVLTLLSSSQGQYLPVPGEGNLSGSRIVASREVAVFSGNVAAREPAGPLDQYVCCGDHLEHQMLPLTTWSTDYAVAPAFTPNGQGNVRMTYRLVGGENGIVLTYDSAPPTMAPTQLDAYEVAYFRTDQGFTVHASKPVGLAQFWLGWGETEAAGGNNGDPAMVVLPATDQFQDGYVFLVPPTYEQSYATVIRPAGSATTLDGAPVGQPAAPAGTVGNVAYEYVHVPVSVGAHTIEGDAPFGLTVYGYADYISYAYPGGAGFEFVAPPPPPQG